jgi:clan AA aspartic protease
VKGHVDSLDRALIVLQVKPRENAATVDLSVWIDTAFNGELVVPRSLILQLQLVQSAAIDAILADGQTVTLETFSCVVDWFGEWRIVEVIANDGSMPLLGVGLLRKRRLTIDYATCELKLE